jgi:hypothetical protein
MLNVIDIDSLKLALYAELCYAECHYAGRTFLSRKVLQYLPKLVVCLKKNVVPTSAFHIWNLRRPIK